MKPLIDWISRMLSNGSSAEPSTKRVAFMTFVAGGFTWLTADLVLHRGITPDWNVAFGVYATTVTGAYLGGKVVERKAAKDAAEADANAAAAGGGT